MSNISLISGCYAAAAVLCLVLGIVCFVIATIQAGKREQGGEIFLNRFDQIPTEAAAALTFMAAFLVLCIGMNLTGTSYSSAVSMAGLVILGMAETALLMGGYLSLVRRCKAKTLVGEQPDAKHCADVLSGVRSPSDLQ